MRTPKLIVATLVGVLGSAAAVAGQYCLMVNGLGANCRFFDQESCARAAVTMGGACIDKGIMGNTGLATASNVAPRDAKYCLVNAGDAKCYYYDAQSCASAAQLEGGTCLTRPKLSTPIK